MAKFADGGCSSLLQSYDLLGLVLVHVGYDVGWPEQVLADHSPLISFSADCGAAFRFADRTQKKALRLCKLDEATHFVWWLEVELSEPLEPGRYPFPYRSDPVNCRTIIAEQLYRGRQREAETGSMTALGDMTTLTTGLLNALAMDAAAKDLQDHYAEIIDVVTFVKSHDTAGRERRLIDNTLERAMRDQEWLVYPKDQMQDGLGLSSRLAMNRHLSVFGCYRELR